MNWHRAPGSSTHYLAPLAGLAVLTMATLAGLERRRFEILIGTPKQVVKGIGGVCPRWLFDGKGEPVEYFADRVRQQVTAPLWDLGQQSCAQPPRQSPSVLQNGLPVYPLVLKRSHVTNIPRGGSRVLVVTATLGAQFGVNDFAIALPGGIDSEAERAFSIYSGTFTIEPSTPLTRTVSLRQDAAARWSLVPKGYSSGPQQIDVQYGEYGFTLDVVVIGQHILPLWLIDNANALAALGIVALFSSFAGAVVRWSRGRWRTLGAASRRLP